MSFHEVSPSILSILKSYGGSKHPVLTIFEPQSTRTLPYLVRQWATRIARWVKPHVLTHLALTGPIRAPFISTMFKITLLFTLFLPVTGQAFRGNGGPGGPGDRGVPPAGPGPFPVPGGCAPLGKGLFPEPEWITIADCTVGPTCAFDREGTEGAWVCRAAYDFFTGASTDVTLCIDPDQALSTDTCGCCGDCPAECTCACTTRDGADGVLIQPNRKADDAEEVIDPQPICLPSANALGIIASGRASCVTECSV